MAKQKKLKGLITVAVTVILVILLSAGTSIVVNKQGAKGDKGDQGEQGIQGAKGDKGDKGEQGIQGEKGDTGAQGDTGRGIAKTEIIDGYLQVTYTDDTTQSFNIGKASENDEIINGNLVYVLQSDGTYGIKAEKNFSLSDVNIPDSYNGITITKILENGFRDCTSIKNLTIPSGVQQIGANAFYNTSLETAVLEESEKWVAGLEGFEYESFSIYDSYGYSDKNTVTRVAIVKYDISDTKKAAKALKGPVELNTVTNVDSDGYTGKRTYEYKYKYIYWCNWSKLK